MSGSDLKEREQDLEDPDAFAKRFGVDFDPAERARMEEASKKLAANDQSPEASGSIPFHNTTKKKKLSSKLKKRLLIGAGVGGVSAIVSGIALFSFINVFKLDHILQNIDAKTFSRFNAQFSGRSNSFLKSYIELRMMQYDGRAAGDASGNLFFRANKVNTGNPMLDWYRTIQTGRFEQNVLNKEGIFFTSVVDSNGRIRPGKITFKGEDIPFDVQARLSPEAFANLTNGKDLSKTALGVNALGKDMDNFLTTEIFQSDKQGRKEIKTFVNNRVHFFQVIKRRQLRKYIQNETGVRDWTFFEKTIAKYRDKKTTIQQKIISKTFPQGGELGKFAECIFAGKCDTSTDIAHAAATNETIPGLDTATQDVVDKNGNVTTKPVDLNGSQLSSDAEKAFQQGVSEDLSKEASAVNTTFQQRMVQRIVTLYIGEEAGNAASAAAGNASAYWKILKLIANIHKKIHNHVLTKMIKKAKLVQFTALYSVFSIARDQARTGQLTANEMQDLMGNVNGFDRSEGWNQANGNQTAPAGSISKADYCAKGHVKLASEFAWNCDDQKPNYGGKVGSFEDAYNNTVGYIFAPIASVVDHVRSIPLVSTFLDFTSKIFGKISSITIDPILSALHITDGISALVTYGMQKFLVFAGVVPVPLQPGIANSLVTGASGTAEGSTRQAGGVVSTPQTLSNSNKIALQYQVNQHQQESLFNRYASISNPTSLASTTLFALSNSSVPKAMASLGSIFSSIGTTIGGLFSGHLLAASSTPASGIATWAGVDTYDIPAQCQNLDPLDPNYLQLAVGVEGTSKYAGTANSIVNSVRSGFTLQNIRDENAFWKLVYDKIGTNNPNAENIAGAIYDCGLLDTQVMGGLGALSGYTSDGGL